MVTEKEIRDYYDRQYSERGENACRPSRAFGIFLDLLEVKSIAKISLACEDRNVRQVDFCGKPPSIIYLYTCGWCWWSARHRASA